MVPATVAVIEAGDSVLVFSTLKSLEMEPFCGDRDRLQHAQAGIELGEHARRGDAARLLADKGDGLVTVRGRHASFLESLHFQLAGSLATLASLASEF